MKRLGVYFFYDPDGHMREYNFVYIESILEFTDKLIVVSNGDIDEESQNRLLEYKLDYWPRENVGFDVGAYKYVLNKIGWDQLNKWDELLICNYTCYGPVYPLHEMMHEMQSRNCDFWGAAMHPEQPVYLLPNKEGYIYRHIMSYFLVIRNKLLSSNHFKWFWNSLPEIKSKNESVGIFETQFTKHFEDLGFVSDSYVNILDYQDRCYNSSIFLANDYLIKSKCPFVKRRAFFFPDYEGLLTYSDTHESIHLMDYINSQTDYDINLIWDDLLSTQKMSSLINNMHLGRVVNDDLFNSETDERIMVAVHVSSVTVLDVFCKHIIYDDWIDYYIFAPDTLYDDVTLQLSNHNNIFVSRFNETRNITLKILIELSEKIFKYQYFGVITNLNAPSDSLSIGLEDYAHYIFSNMIGSSGVISYVIERYKSTDRLGCIVPRETCFSKYYAYHIQRMRNGMLDRYHNCYDELKLTVPFDTEMYTNGGGVFWLDHRSIAILEIYIDKYISILSKDCFDYFVPMLIQEKGLYTETFITTENARVILDIDQWNRHKLIDYSAEQFNVYPWDARSIRNAKKVEYRTIRNEMSREDILETHFSFREILKILSKYPAHKKEYINKCKRNKFECDRNKARIYVKGLFIDGNRIILCLFSKIHNLKSPYLQIGKKKFFPYSEIDSEMEATQKYMLENYEFQELFFEIPIDDRDLKIEMYSDDHHSALNWANGINYNSFDLHKKGFYSRIDENGNVLIEKKKQYVRNVLKSQNYSIKDKFLFILLLMNPFHHVTLIGENLGAGDNSFQIFKYCIENKLNNVFYLCSKEIKSEEDNKRLKKKMIVFNSKKHHFLQAFVDKWIGSYSFQLEMLTTTSTYKDIHYNMLHGRWFFVPHGMAVGDKEVAMLYQINWGNPECTFVNSLLEREAYANKYKFNNVIYCGSPRMDKWWNAASDDNHLIVFFTWRMGLSKGRIKKDDIKKNYYINGIINCIKLIQREKPNSHIHYVFHHEVVKVGMDEVIKEKLGDSCEYIYFNSLKGVNEFNHWFANAKYLITDFSSVSYDFSYKNDSVVICYIPDDFIANHYEVNSKFYEIQPGRIVKNDEEFCNALNLSTLSDDELVKREKFFSRRDGNNTRRVFDAIFNDEYLNKYEIRNPRSNCKKSTSNIKRLSIFMVWDPKGVIDNYIIYYLKEIKKVCVKSCVVVNGIINKRDLNALKSACDDVLIRENVGFDSWAYKHVLEYYGYDNIASLYDEIVLSNYTCFGPFFPFSEMFDTMNDRECDFWGHVRYVPTPGQSRDGDVMPEHLQSHFLVFRKSILKSNSFKNYWITLKRPNNYSEAILFHELRCTDYFEKRGFISDSYIKEYSLPEYSFNSPVYMAYPLVAEYRSPLVKRKVFYIKNGEFEFPLHTNESVYDLLEYIKQYSKYDIKLIYENIARFMDLKKDTSDDRISDIQKNIKCLTDKNAEKYLVYREQNRIFISSKFFDLFD